MKVVGFTFIRNAVKNDYPIAEAILSILPICDEFVVALGNSEDETEKLITDIGSSKIRIIHTVWDESLREGGAAFAAETDKAFQAISSDADWAFYIQGDECVHEKYLSVIQKEMVENLHRTEVQGLLFKYLHFYGSYDFTASSRRWYKNEIRILRFDRSIHAYRDAQGFRINGNKLYVKPIDAYIFHYGWVKPPVGLGNKVRNFNQFYTNEAWAAKEIPENYEFDYGNAHKLLKFKDEHPAVMKKRVNACNWKFSIDPTTLKRKMSIRYRILEKIEELTGWRIGEYKNYKKIS